MLSLPETVALALLRKDKTMSFPSRPFDQLRGMSRYRDSFAPLLALRLGEDGKTPQAYTITPELIGADPSGTAQHLIDSLRTGWTPERVLLSDDTGDMVASDITAVQLGSLASISGNVQAQLNGRSLVGHTHEMVETNGLLAAMSNKADLVNGKIPDGQINHTTITEYKGDAANEAAMLAIPDVGMSDWVYRTDLQTAFMLALPDSSLASSWRSLGPTNGIVTVNGIAGSHITLGYADVGACSATDSRLSNSRTPTAHALSHLEGGSDALSLTQAQVTGLTAALNAKLNSNDATVTNARTPLAHAASHAAGGSDALTLSQSQISGLAASLLGKYDTSGGILSGDVWVRNNLTGSNGPAFKLSNVTNPEWYAEMRQPLNSQLVFEKRSPGECLIDFQPLPFDGTSNALVRLFRATNTTGNVYFDIHRGDNTAPPNSRLGGNTHSYLNVLVGNFGIGTSSPTRKLDIDATSIRLRQSLTPASASATGVQGEICWDSGYLYVCVAANTWKRVALLTF